MQGIAQHGALNPCSFTYLFPIIYFQEMKFELQLHHLLTSFKMWACHLPSLSCRSLTSLQVLLACPAATKGFSKSGCA